MDVVVHWTVAALLAGCSGGDSQELSAARARSEQPPPEAPLDGSVTVRVVARDVVDPEVDPPGDGCTDGPAESVVVDADGNLSGSAVWVDDATDLVADAAVRLSNCRFDQRVVVLPPGSQLTLRNDDPVEHDLVVGERDDVDESDSEDQEPISGGEERQLDLPDADVAFVRIGSHPWEQVLVVRASRGVVTDAAGRATLSRLPPGSHTVHVLHPLLGQRDAELSVTPGKATMLEVLYHGP